MTAITKAIEALDECLKALKPYGNDAIASPVSWAIRDGHEALADLKKLKSEVIVDIDALIPDFVENCGNAPLLENKDHGLLSCFIDHLRAEGII